MRDATWNTDDIVVLHEKWRLADDLAASCERISHALDIARIQMEHLPKGGEEIASKTQECRRRISSCASALLETGLTKSDWDWFQINHLSADLESIRLVANQVYRLSDPVEIARAAGKMCSEIAKIKRKFADALRHSLHECEQTKQTGTWYQTVHDGVRIHGRLVELSETHAPVLVLLCERRNVWTGYEHIAELRTEWAKKSDSDDDDEVKSIQSNIRTAITNIRKALRKTFDLGAEEDPVPSRGKGKWRLNTDLLERPAS
jgi:hypothetical protein